MIVPNSRPGSCDRWQLLRLLPDDLTDVQASQLAEHLDSCHECRELLDDTLTADEPWQRAKGLIAQRVTPAEPTRSTMGNSHYPRETLAWLPPYTESIDREKFIGLLDQYPILRVVGLGGMGIVFEGWDRELHRPVAIKAMHPHLAAIGVARERFVREARCAASVVHPNVIAIHRINADHFPPYLVMALIAGESLQSRLDREGLIPRDRALRITAQVAQGLAAAEQQGLVHRDVKPANILVEHGTDRAVLTDFGLVRALNDATVTMSGTIAGTPQYMSPEQARGDELDHRSDVYSLGAVLYALLTGHPPHEAQSPLALVRKIAEDKPRPITYFDPSTPRSVQQFVQRIMEPELKRRIASAADVAQHAMELHAHLLNPATHKLPKALRTRTKDWLEVVLSRRTVFIAACILLVFILWPLPRKPLGSPNNSSSPHVESSTPWIVDVDKEIQQLNEAANRLEASMTGEIESLNRSSK